VFILNNFENSNLEHDFKVAGIFKSKEDINFNLNNAIESEIKINEVSEDMAKKKTESNNTEIVASKPKAKPFIPNPKKRTKKSQVKKVKEPEYEDEYMDDYEPDNDMDDNDNDSKPGNDKSFLDDYKIGGLDL